MAIVRGFCSDDRPGRRVGVGRGGGAARREGCWARGVVERPGRSAVLAGEWFLPESGFCRRVVFVGAWLVDRPLLAFILRARWAHPKGSVWMHPRT
jgi:hypothetical protein